ncbi:hypothetical protein ACGFZB_21590 [Streptomyces cinerochromogenes]|uniref:Poly A polymerase head domain-containing protein n=1 Tax=Streptomyces cinerochromogenes TaxID=66422 RepID=A0ABW7BBG8_9ACTN
MDRTGRRVRDVVGTPSLPQQRGDGRTGPILTGDTVEDRPVVGFACTARTLPTARDDQLVLGGEEEAGHPPLRSTDPADQPSLTRTGPHPCEQLEPDRIHRPDDIRPGLAGRFQELLHGPRSLPFTAPLIERLAASGHHSWLSGGAPRDVVTGAGPGGVHDLDLTGTAPAGAFTEAARAVLDLDGLSAEHVQRFNPATLTCAILDPVARTHGPTLDYRGLGLLREATRFPATGSDLLQDSRQRDLTVNTLLYDPLRDLVVDPLGQALDDLGDEPRQGPLRLVPALASTDPLARAEVLLRGLKFLLRWHRRPGEPDDEPLRAWARALPADLLDRIDARGPDTWHHLAALWEQCVPDPTAPAVAEAVQRLGTVASRLHARLLTEAA